MSLHFHFTTMLLFVLYLVLPFLSASTSTFSIQKFNQTKLLQVYYIGFSSDITTYASTDTAYTFVNENLTLVSKTDDAPFQSVILPYSNFVLFGHRVGRIFVSANGAVHYSYVQPVPNENVFGVSQGVPQSPFNATYFGCVAGFLTDLNPSNSSGNITAQFASTSDGRGLDYVSIKYKDIKFYGSHHANSFRIVLYSDSHIELKFDSVFSGVNELMDKSWISGLRPPENDSLTFIDSTQLEYGVTEWSTTAPGVYTSKETVLNGQQFTACPVSMSWCLSPSSIYKSQGATELNITTLLLSCTERLVYGLYLSQSEPSPDTSISKTSLLVMICDPTDPAAGDTLRQFSCAVPASSIAQLSTALYYVTPVWRIKDSNDDFIVLPIASMKLIVFASGSNANSQCYYNSLSYNYSSSVCPYCDICHRDIDCLDLPCQSSTHPVLYEWPSCNNTCPTDLTSNKAYYSDSNNVCCELEDMDCGGICYGTQKLSYFDATMTQYACCSKDTKVDCAGICGGSTPIDACGVCNGTDSTGITCFAYENVTVSTSVGVPYFNAVFDVQLNGAPLFFYFNITNKSNATIIVKLSISNPDDDYAPVIGLPPQKVMKMGEQHAFKFNVSLVDLYKGTQLVWKTKTITVQYYRQVYTTKVYSSSYPVYLSSNSCSTLTNGQVVSPYTDEGAAATSLCLRLPTCMFCLSNNNVRILRSVENNSVDFVNDNNSSVRRSLFNYLLPNDADNDDRHLYDGYCADGSTVEVCTADVRNLGTNSAHGGIVSWEKIIVLYVVCLLSVLLIL